MEDGQAEISGAELVQLRSGLVHLLAGSYPGDAAGLIAAAVALEAYVLRGVAPAPATVSD